MFILEDKRYYSVHILKFKMNGVQNDRITYLYHDRRNQERKISKHKKFTNTISFNKKIQKGWIELPNGLVTA